MRPHALLASLAAAGALVFATAPAAVAEPTTTPPATTTTAASAIPTPTESATTTPMPMATLDDSPTTSSVAPSTTATPIPEVEAPKAAGGLTVWTGPLVLNGAPKPGGVVSGQMDVQVEDTRAGSSGWSVDVKTTAASGSNGAGFAPGPDSYYRAASTACSTSAGTIPLTLTASTVATSHQSCPDARWTSDVGIAIPPDAVPADYALTITHSVY